MFSNQMSGLGLNNQLQEMYVSPLRRNVTSLTFPTAFYYPTSLTSPTAHTFSNPTHGTPEPQTQSSTVEAAGGPLTSPFQSSSPAPLRAELCLRTPLER